MPWKRTSSGSNERFSYLPCGSWSSRQTIDELAIVTRLLETPLPGSAQATDATRGWARMMAELPLAFRNALLSELVAGNTISGIESSDWPAPGSTIVHMQNRFTVARHSPPAGVVWHGVNDPHYWKEDLEQKIEDRIFLAIV